uniref:BRI3 binding protein n=1 Tax=Rhinopithecus roxellana TaxID=61622 RepID=A0A2K6R3Z0_RHIRO
LEFETSLGNIARPHLYKIIIIITIIIIKPGVVAAPVALENSGVVRRNWVMTVFFFLQFLARLTERFVLGVDMFVETLWKVWTELLDVLGLDVSNLSQYFSPASVSSSPARALLLVGVVLLAYWFLSLTLGFTFSVLHVVFGRFFWIVRVVLFSMSCVYILHKYEGEPENAVLPLCFVVAVYFMTGPMGFYWRSSPSNPSNPSVEEKLEHLEKQVRLLNIRLNRVLESLDRSKDK